MNLRNRRIEMEWQLLEALADANHATFAAITRSEDEFRVDMRESPAWVGNHDRRVETAHVLRYAYPRYYPSLPLEGYFLRPIFHINVEPVTGFVCLWRDYRPTQTIVDAILITRAIMAGKAANRDPAHHMQPDAVSIDSESGELPMPLLTLPTSCRSPLPQRHPGRRRLSSSFDDKATCESDFALSNTE